MHTDTSCNGESTHASGRCRARENGTLTYSCVKEGVTRSKFCLAPGFVWETSQSYPCWTLTLSRLTAACSRGPQGIATARQDAATTLTSPRRMLLLDSNKALIPKPHAAAGLHCHTLSSSSPRAVHLITPHEVCICWSGDGPS